ncbi:hypothetical protein QQS21_006030 [Conoideocrella luteorostrata]|uniref:F-box domain-containing protein n=1 Tax=Conoideocrella luteorostrata TaxID=1105319 RepID=A0AAJ0CQQ1_9HYPO|nr:hypothetical protein QQS21_006030 [Conoideocrella luteorostrata]
MASLGFGAWLAARFGSRRLKPPHSGSQLPRQPPEHRAAKQAHQIFEIAELLSLVLENLDQRTLFTVQRVCKTWRAVIASSPSLTRHLFTASTTPVLSDAGRKHSRELNPLIDKLLPRWVDTIKITASAELSKNWFEVTRASTRFESCLPFLARGHDNPFFRKGASWLDLHVSHPPITRVAVQTVYSKLQLYRQHVQLREYPRGMRMLDLYVIVLHWVCRGDQPRRFQVLHPAEGNVRSEHIDAACVQALPGYRDFVQGAESISEVDEMGAELFVQLHSPLACCPRVMPEEDKEFWNIMCGASFFEREHDEG